MDAGHCLDFMDNECSSVQTGLKTASVFERWVKNDEPDPPNFGVIAPPLDHRARTSVSPPLSLPLESSLT